ncbi:MAG: hypothetical protein HFJ07_18560 [Lachnospiraceae bacterium]|nr:hypothetical protein [Lachnospiraceae bacterium]
MEGQRIDYGKQVNSSLLGGGSRCFTVHSIILTKGEIYRHLSTWRVKEMKKLQGYLSSAIKWITAVRRKV